MFKFIKLNETYLEQNDLELSQIANMDETQIFLNMTRSKRIAKIGSKTVNIKTHGQDKVRVIAILWIVADGTKLLQCWFSKVNLMKELQKNLKIF